MTGHRGSRALEGHEGPYREGRRGAEHQGRDRPRLAGGPALHAGAGSQPARVSLHCETEASARPARKASAAWHMCRRRASARRTMLFSVTRLTRDQGWSSLVAREDRTFVRLFLQPLQPVRARTMLVFFGRGGAGLYMFRPRQGADRAELSGLRT